MVHQTHGPNNTHPHASTSAQAHIHTHTNTNPLEVTSQQVSEQ